jgi:predicted small lipoprotein YifL
MKRLANIVLIMVSAMAVTACGLRGSLERPPPLWGDPPVAEEAETTEHDESDDEG